MFTEEELEVLEMICLESRASIVERANEDKWHSKEYLELCVNNERIVSSILEKVRKM